MGSVRGILAGPCESGCASSSFSVKGRMPLLLPRLAKCGGGVFPEGCPGGVPWQSWPGVLAGCRGASFLAGWSGRVSWEAVLAWRGWGKSRKSHKSPEIVDFAEPTPFPEEIDKVA